MKNKLIDLNDHLFAQIERLSNEDLKGEELVEEINRAKSVTSVASQIISNGNLLLDAKKVANDFFEEYGKQPVLPKLLTDGV